MRPYCETERWVRHLERSPVSMVTHLLTTRGVVDPPPPPPPPDPFSIYLQNRLAQLRRPKTRQSQQVRLHVTFKQPFFFLCAPSFLLYVICSSYFVRLSLLSLLLWLGNSCRGSNLYLKGQMVQDRWFCLCRGFKVNKTSFQK